MSFSPCQHTKTEVSLRGTGCHRTCWGLEGELGQARVRREQGSRESTEARCGAYTTRWALVSGSNDLEDVLPRLCCSDTLHLEKETDPSCFHLYLNYPRMQSGPEHLKAKPHGETEVVIQRSSEQLRNVSTSPFPGQCKRLH